MELFWKANDVILLTRASDQETSRCVTLEGVDKEQNLSFDLLTFSVWLTVCVKSVNVNSNWQENTSQPQNLTDRNREFGPLSSPEASAASLSQQLWSATVFSALISSVELLSGEQKESLHFPLSKRDRVDVKRSIIDKRTCGFSKPFPSELKVFCSVFLRYWDSLRMQIGLSPAQ